MSDAAWTWDPTLFAGSAAYYVQGRAGYPPELATRLAAEIGLDGTGRLLDVGCGPGSLTLPLAAHVARAVGVDADPDMVVTARAQAALLGVDNTEWRHLRAEELPADLGTFRLITFAQSFHWMDRPLVAATARTMLAADGVLVHVHATTHRGLDPAHPLTDTGDPVPFTDDGDPIPPHAAIAELVRRYLGPVRRAGRGFAPQGTVSGESETYRAAGFHDPHRFEIPGRVITRTIDDIVAATFSQSGSTPHLFGDRAGEFERDLRELLAATSPTGRFRERLREIAVDIWQP